MPSDAAGPDGEERLPELWIIEAPGKARTLEGILARLGLDARVQATKGHLLTMPDRLTPVGIDANLHEFLRAPRDADLYARIRDMAKEATKLVIATDADAEGDVIGWDAADAVSDIHPAPVRVKLRGMDDESVREAIAVAGAMRKEDAVPGRTRAIVDRLIGSVFSRDGVAVGRVGTAVLGLVARDKPSVWRLRLSAPAKDGGRPWLAECDAAKAPLTKAAAERLAKLDLPAMDMLGSRPFTAPPGHTGDIMVRASERLDISPVETAKAMQRVYETGRMSYPRAASRGLSRVAAMRMKKALQKAGHRFDEASVAGKAEDEVHDAPHPIGPIDTSLDPRRLGHDEGIRIMVARDLVRTGQKHVIENPATERLERFLIAEGFTADIAALIAKLPWRREQGPRYPGQESWGDSCVERRRPDTVLLEAILDAGLGRASTWANHVESFLKRGLVDDELGLTAKGREWIASSPPELLDPRLSVAIEKACDRVGAALFADPSREPWEMLSERIVRALPPGIRGPVMQAAAATGPQLRRDFRAMAEPGLDFDALKAAAPMPGYMPPDMD